jgi:hypothetical protein
MGGVLGFGLLLLRWRIAESLLFRKTEQKSIPRGEAMLFFRSPDLLIRYLRCLALGAPIWIFVGIFITLSPEIAKALGVAGQVSAGKAILFYNIGFGTGDIGSALLSQLLRSRKKAVAAFLLLSAIAVSVYASAGGATPAAFYGICLLLGVGGGYWSVFLMLSAEQFGTNMRATVATSLPNLVRVLVIPLTLLLRAMTPAISLGQGAVALGFVSLLIAAAALRGMEDTYSRSLDFNEGSKAHGHDVSVASRERDDVSLG